MKKALFFDLDGTLWDALIPLVDSYNETYKRLGREEVLKIEDIQKFMGITPVETIKYLFKPKTEEEGWLFFSDEIKYLKTHPGKPYPNEEEVLSSLSNKYDLYIVSNCVSGYIEDYLDGLNMNKYFKGHLAAGDTGLEKWQNILKLKNENKIDQVIYIGDTLKDKIESEKAGVQFIHAAYGFGKIESTKYSIESLMELEKMVERVFDNL